MNLQQYQSVIHKGPMLLKRPVRLKFLAGLGPIKCVPQLSLARRRGAGGEDEAVQLGQGRLHRCSKAEQTRLAEGGGHGHDPTAGGFGGECKGAQAKQIADAGVI